MVVLLRAEEDREVRGYRERRLHVVSVHEVGVHRHCAVRQHCGLEAELVLPRQPKTSAANKVAVRTNSNVGMVQPVDVVRE